MNRKEILKSNILGLLSGKKRPEDIYPDCVCKIGYAEENIYLVNRKEVSQEEYNKAIANYDGEGFTITYGGKQ